jgi:hypothetical protein
MVRACFATRHPCNSTNRLVVQPEMFTDGLQRRKKWGKTAVPMWQNKP